ncbi:hypothetical protein VTO73DRAFT_9179 [Trametes versicolor]
MRYLQHLDRLARHIGEKDYEDHKVFLELLKKMASISYPERLGRALVVNVPFLVNAFFKLITPFIDPLTRPKLRFNPNCLAEGLFPPEELIAEWGGSAHVEYKHERYWEPLVRMCAERRERLWEKWREAGAKVGVREWDVKCALELEDAKKEAPAPMSVTAEVAKEEVAAPVIAGVAEEPEVAKEPERRGYRVERLW